MSCVVGLMFEGEVWMGGDSYGSIKGVSYPGCLPKFCRRAEPNGAEMLLGGCGTDRFNNAMRYNLQIPAFSEGDDIHRYLNCDFTDAIRASLRNAGLVKVEDGQEYHENSLLLAFKGALYYMGSDFNFTSTPSRDFLVIGSGEDFAMGALHAGLHLTKLSAQAIVTSALQAASSLGTTVAPPFHVEKL